MKSFQTIPMALLVALAVALPCSAQLFQPIGEPAWMKFPPISAKYKGSSTYADVMNHSHESKWRGSYDTTAHETLHGIHASIRNNSARGNPVNAFYVGQNRAIIIEEPRTTIRSVAGYVPLFLRGSRFQLYLNHSVRDWNNHPLYILDEGVAYLMGSQANIESDSEEPGVKSNAVLANLEFSIYATALGMAVMGECPEYWRTNKDFKAFLRWYVSNALATYHQGIKLPQFQFSSPLYERLKGPVGAPFRKFWQDDLNLDLAKLLP